MGKALDGDKSADVALKPGDVVSIQQLAGWQDIGSSVTITGEVEHAGSYAIQTGERLSSVLKRAGGFRTDAYPYAAVLQRAQVRQQNEQARKQMIRQIEDTPVLVRQGTIGTQTARYSKVTRDAAARDSREPSQSSRQWTADDQHLF